jgi:probable addiction module antidote protein
MKRIAEEFTELDIATLLRSDEATEDFLKEFVEEGDISLIAHAIGIAARAKGMSKIAGETGLAREALYRSFSEDGNPSLKSTIAVLKSMGLALSVRSLAAVEAERKEILDGDDEPCEAAE